jgi:SAM-dependent methyltransferase
MTELFSQRIHRACPVCGHTAEGCETFLDEMIDPSRVTGASYASRKAPEFMNLKLVVCPGCTTVFAPTPPGASTILEAYHTADYDSSTEAEQAAATYARSLAPHLAGMKKRAALEVGTGSGAFLARLADAGFEKVVGIEPSSAAIAAGSPRVRPWIKEGIFQPADYAGQSFDLIACFMTLEHVSDPGALVRSFFDVLAPGGKVALVVHDRTALLNRTLARRSPIIDIEHLQLFSPESMRHLLRSAGYTDLRIAPFVNRYRLSYWMRLLPLPDALKSPAIDAASAIGLGDRPVSMNVGNLFCVATKP